MNQKKVAILGAGLTGLSAARHLKADRNIRLEIVEKEKNRLTESELMLDKLLKRGQALNINNANIN